MSHSDALISLESICESYANVKGDYSKKNTYRFLQLLIEGLGEFNIFSSVGKINWYAGSVGDDGCIYVPVDFIDYIRIGTPIQGLIYTLTRNENLEMPIGMECGVVTGAENVTQLPTVEPLYWNWTTVDYASTGGHNFAYYRYDKENRRIVFKGDVVGRSIIIEYITTGINMSGNTYVPREYMQLMKLYLNWQLKLYAGDRDTEYAAREFAIEKDKVKSFQFALRPDEFLDNLRLLWTRAIRR